MPTANPHALTFLQTRRSHPLKTLIAPGPDAAALAPLLAAALRVPDHGKLEPWRLIALQRPALSRLADLAERRAAALGLDAEQAAKGRSQFDQSPCAIAVICAPKASPKVPQIEQQLSSAAVCLSLLNAALAAGWGAAWLTGWPAYDREFLATGLGLAPHESLTGFIHVGTATLQPSDRPRPDAAGLVTWAAT